MVAPTCARVQVVELNVPEAAGAALKVTVPVGNDFVPESLSETTVVQVEAWPNATEAGLQVNGGRGRALGDGERKPGPQLPAWARAAVRAVNRVRAGHSPRACTSRRRTMTSR